ncbi:MAG: 2-amino-4-hydroxy-6-hydroxymethyldihydropteridine diphosphokinase [Verrucomicrobia bacterium]|nr:2-amino-4-hydroxy-6-hydroxymethyldihydropteridine diphosphokinase [Verrucomicrobiota bacterium]MDE3099597.1 2-amino-4-hydroxy-6-hydroxymethyldihydropteridine diphosphokinase [Verrucomicrobiota bacterium]
MNAKSNIAFIALGSNLGDSRKIILDAMSRLEQFSDQPVLRSSLWRTSPVLCPPGSPDFVNAVIGLIPRPCETAHSLLGKLQALEKDFGRAPAPALNAPRPLDLDLLAFGDEACQSATLTLPHPRAHLRKFVLQPLAEIAPDFILPGQTRTVRQLLAAITSDETLAPL